MMLERFTDGARQILVQAQHAARRLGHDHIGTEHLLLAVAAATEPASAVLREHGVTPERIEAQMISLIGRGYPALADPLGGLDREALAAIGIDLDVVRARLEAAFGPDALTQAVPARKRAAAACQRSRRPALGKGPVARLMHVRRARRPVTSVLVPHGRGPRFTDPPSRSGHIPFTPGAKKSLELSLREAVSLNDNHIGVQHLALALLAVNDGMAPKLLSALSASAASLRTAILDRYRKAS